MPQQVAKLCGERGPVSSALVIQARDTLSQVLETGRQLPDPSLERVRSRFDGSGPGPVGVPKLHDGRQLGPLLFTHRSKACQLG